MKLPIRWLEAYVPVSLPPRELAERLTMSGSLVEAVVNTGSQFDEVLIGRVAELQRHPNADRLWLATIDLGERRQTVVTGAQNLFAGALVPFVGVGSRLPGQEKPLEGRKLMGILSEGMVCSPKELGLGDDHSGILILDQAVLGEHAAEAPALLGRPLSELLGEWVLELEITSNRPDCLSIFGLAREVAAITGEPLVPPTVALTEELPAAADLASVRIEAPDLCTGYVARVITGVRIGPSPSWLAGRLQAAGVRPINNVVDVTNYVMLELGQPLHAFDLDRLAGRSIIVRRTLPGERLTTLDGVERSLSPDMLLIADAERAVGIAGVMGGGNSEVGDETTNLLLESATFVARNVRRTSQALGLRTEASSRFEKGLPRALSPLAADRAAALIAELTGGAVAMGAIDVGEPAPPPRAIEFDPREVARLLGVDWTVGTIIGSLLALGFTGEELPDGRLRVLVPWWRDDVQESADLVEEVARSAGYDAIPETLLRGSVVPVEPTAGQRWSAVARSALLASGLSEGSSPSLTARQLLDRLRPEGGGDDWLATVVPNPEALRRAGALAAPVGVVNPLTPEREILRATLLPGLLEALRDNLRSGEDRVAFFELDFCVFRRPDTLPLERRTLALALAGERQPRSWASPPAAIDFFDLKGVVEELLLYLGLRQARLVPAQHPLLHPGRSAVLQLGDDVPGFLGELHPLLGERWDLGGHRAYVAEFDFDALAAVATDQRAFVEYPRLPVAKRDLAVVVDEDRSVEEVLGVIREAGKKLLARVTLFDVYRGEPIPAGKKSLACALDLQAADHTLTEDEVEKALNGIQRALQYRLGATFRA